jgi:hypothetical protein
MATTFLVNNDTQTPFVSGSAGLQVVRGTATPYAGSPVGAVAGLQGNFLMDTSTDNVWYCTVAGPSGSVQWQQVLTNPANFAAINGSSAQVFNMASGTTGSEGINYTQLTNSSLSPSFASGSFTQPVSGVAATASSELTTLGQLQSGFAQLGAINTFTASQNIDGALAVTGVATAASGTATNDLVTYGQLQSELASGSGIPYDVAGGATGTLSAGQVLMNFFTPRALTFPANFSGSVGGATASGSTATTFAVDVNGAAVGTLSIAASGTAITFASSGGAVTNISAGDTFTVSVSGTPATAVANPSFTFAGSIA